MVDNLSVIHAKPAYQKPHLGGETSAYADVSVANRMSAFDP